MSPFSVLIAGCYLIFRVIEIYWKSWNKNFVFNITTLEIGAHGEVGGQARRARCLAPLYTLDLDRTRDGDKRRISGSEKASTSGNSAKPKMSGGSSTAKENPTFKCVTF